MSANANVNVNLNYDLNNFVQQWGMANCAQDAFVHRTLDHFASLGYNVFVCHPPHLCHGYESHCHAEIRPNVIGTIGFDIYVSRGPMTGTNCGDGGFSNWGFSGHWSRDGQTITFY